MKLKSFCNKIFLIIAFSFFALAASVTPHQAFATISQQETGVLWMNRNYFLQALDPQVDAWDLTTGRLVVKFFPFARPKSLYGIAYDPTDGNLWVTEAQPVPGAIPVRSESDGYIHKISSQDGSLLSTIPDPSGRAGIRALDYDADEHVLWALQLWERGDTQNTIYKLDPSNGAVLKTCSIPVTNGVGNDTLTIATPSDLNGEKVLLTDDGTVAGTNVSAIDVNTCAIVKTYTLPMYPGPTGMDFNGNTGNLVVTTSSVVYNMGTAPFDSPHSILPALESNMDISFGALPPAGPQDKVKYVAFGDSLTTGFSVPTCTYDLSTSPWGCNGDRPATPYPDKVAQALGYTYSDDPADYITSAPKLPKFDLARVGIWGYTALDAAVDKGVGKDSAGPWDTQLDAISKATNLVTGELGVNDLHFSDVGFWSKYMLLDAALGTHYVASTAKDILDSPSVSSALDILFSKLNDARVNGAKVVIALVYNPMGSGSLCTTLHDGAAELVNTLDDELQTRATNNGLLTADFRPAFDGHGAGDSNPYTFGSQCEASDAITDYVPTWFHNGTDAASANVQAKYDPHPNDEGTTAMANAILATLHTIQ